MTYAGKATGGRTKTAAKTGATRTSAETTAAAWRIASAATMESASDKASFSKENAMDAWQVTA